MTVQLPRFDDYESMRRAIRVALHTVSPGETFTGSGLTRPPVRAAVADALPLSAVHIDGDTFTYKNEPRDFGHWVTPWRPVSDHMLYIPVVNRLDLLAKAVRSVAQQWPNTVIVDQTVDGIGHGWEKTTVYRADPCRPISFTQMMNWAIDTARMRGLRYLVFMHNDAEAIDGAAESAIEMARRLDAQKERWSLIFTRDQNGSFYDHLVVYNMEAVLAIGHWDESFDWYVSDNDFYHRLRAAGPQKHCAEARVIHHRSQTSFSDTKLVNPMRIRHKMATARYLEKWGGPIGSELFQIPYNGNGF